MKNIINFILLSSIFSSVNGQVKAETYQFSADIARKIEKDTLSWKNQMGATNYSISSYYKKAMETRDKDGGKIQKLTNEDSLYFNTFHTEDAKSYILNRSKNEQIIIINEAHHNARHRVFTTSLLQGLYNNGYRFFGLEAISDTLINKRKFVNTESGFYTNEPQMANLINDAIKIGFTIFDYESVSDSNGKQREIEQAQNITKLIEKNPNSKFLIHCGHDHVNEGTPGIKSWEKAMAGRLNEYSKINPFTIEQTQYSERGNPQFNKSLIKLVNLDIPIIAVDKNGKTFNGKIDNNQTDCSIIHPITKYINERPDWLTLNGERKRYKIPKNRIQEYPVLVLAYNLGEYEQNGVPSDVVEILEKQNTNELILKKGKYKIIIKNKNYEVINQYEKDIN